MTSGAKNLKTTQTNIMFAARLIQVQPKQQEHCSPGSYPLCVLIWLPSQCVINNAECVLHSDSNSVYAPHF